MPANLGDVCVRWRKSSYSGTNGNCVEVATLATGIAVRDSKNPDGPVLAVAPVSWAVLTKTQR